MRRLSFREYCSISSTNQFVTKMNHRLTNILQMRAHGELIIVLCRSFVAAARIGDSDKTTVTLLHVTIRKTELPQHLHPTNFKPYKIISVINHTHLVGLGVTH